MARPVIGSSGCIDEREMTGRPIVRSEQGRFGHLSVVLLHEASRTGRGEVGG